MRRGLEYAPDALDPTVVAVAGFHLGPDTTYPLLEAEAAARRVVGARFGIIRDCSALSWRDGRPGLPVYVARGTRQLPGWSSTMPIAGTGVAPDRRLAYVSAVAEAVERYCAMGPVPAGLLFRRAFEKISDRAVDPLRFALLSADQYAVLPRIDAPQPDKVMDWCWTFSLTQGRPALVPAAFVHFSVGGTPPNNVLPELGSSGLACGVSLPRVGLAGLCEVLERDALTVAWHSRVPVRRLDPRGTEVEALLAGPLRGRAQFSLFEIPTDSPFPVVLALAERATSFPYAAVGAACRPHPTQAATRALCEAAQIVRRQDGRPPAVRERVRSFEDHAEVYASAEGAALLRDTLRVSPQPRRLCDLPNPGTGSIVADLERAVQALARIGLEVLVAEITTADVAAAGLRVTRVLVPGALDMSADPRFLRLAAPRLYDVPVRLGVRAIPLPLTELNRLPVPLS